MTHNEYLQTFLELVKQEGPYHVIEFRLIDEEEDKEYYWLTVQLPEPYTRIESLRVLSGLTFESVDFEARTVRFVLDYDDVVETVNRCKSSLKETPEKPAN